MDDLTNRVIKGYVMRELIGVGGFAAVYRAHQPAVDREVAVKIILSHYASNPDFVRRFEAEAQLVARLEHIHIVPLYDYWRESNNAYLVMRWLRGGSLYQSIAIHGAWELAAAARLLDQIAAALTVAHRSGVIHRDLTPANILLDEERNAYLADFGIAKDALEGQEFKDEQLYGSPAYMAPEQIKNEPVSPQTDIYSLGLVLYQMLTGKAPFEAPTQIGLLDKQLYESVPVLQLHRPDIPYVLNSIILRATAKNPSLRYPDALSLAADFRRAVKQYVADEETPLPASDRSDEPQTGPIFEQVRTLVLEPETLILTMALEPQNPYKGLRPFDEADSQDFFGRRDLVEQLLGRLADHRFLALVGPSGSGKSSVAKAGLIPAVRRGELPNSENWFVGKMVPGAQPFQELETVLLSVAFDASTTLIDALHENEQGVSNVVRRILPAGDSELFLLIDQFEEIFTLVESEAERELFLNSLLAAVTDPNSRLRVVVTLRADFYDRPLLYGGFGQLMRDRTEVVLPLSADELQEAIVEPARHAGLIFDQGLMASIVADVSDQPGALPLLQYALTELFERRAGNRLTVEAYQTSGGVLGALAQRAEELYVEMAPPLQEATRQMFLRLVNLGDGVEDSRQRVRWAGVVSIGQDNRDRMQAVLDAFGKYRLLTFDRDPQTREPTVEVAHEALIREWQRLRDWLNDNREALRTRQRLSISTLEWLNAGKDPSFLATGTRLGQYETLHDTAALQLTQDEYEYLRSSIALRQRATNRFRLFIAGLIMFSLVALGLAVFAFDRQRQAEKERDRADLEAQISRSRELAATALSNIDQLDLSLLLSLEALDTADTFEARNSLLTALQTSPHLAAFLHGHTDQVRSVAYSPDGRLIASASRDGQILLWDAETRQVTGAPLAGHEGRVNSIMFSPDGRLLVSGGEDGTVRLWDVEGRTADGDPLIGHTDVVWGTAFSPDGRLVASASADNTIRLWDVETRAAVGEPLEGHTDYVYSVVFSPDGSLLASGSADNTIRLWDVETRAAVGEPLVGHENWVWSVVFSPDGRLIASSSADNTIRLWDVVARQFTGISFSGHTGMVRSVDFSPDGRLIASGSDDAAVRLWDVETGLPYGDLLLGQGDNVWSVAFSPDGQTLVSGSEANALILWSVQDRYPLGRTFAMYPDEVSALAYSPDGMLLAAAVGSHTGLGEVNIVEVLDTATASRVATLDKHGSLVTSVVFSPDGKRLVSGSGDETIIPWDVQTGQPAMLPLSASNGILFSVAYSPDGTLMASGGADGSVVLWDTATWQPSGQALSGHTDNVLTVAFSPDGRLLASGGHDRAVILWDVTTREPVGEPLQGHTDSVTSLVFSPDGNFLASGSRDMTIILWDLSAEPPRGERLLGHNHWVLSLAFSPDGHLLASGSRDGSMRLWNVSTRRALGQPFRGHTNWVSSVAFSPDGQTLASGSWDGTVIFWQIRLVQWQSRACTIANRTITAEEWERFLGQTPYHETCQPGDTS